MSEAWGRGLATVTTGGRVLDVLYPDPVLGREGAPEGPGTTVLAEGEDDERRGTKNVEVVTVLDDLHSAPTDAYDAYLRLHLLSHRLVKPRELSMEGIFGVLPNVAWTSHGPVDPAELPAVPPRPAARAPRRGGGGGGAAAGGGGSRSSSTASTSSRA